jgi:serine/threonine-protein kinase RIO1
LQDARLLASRADRERWALELLGAVSWLEEMGVVHGDLAVRNLGVDRQNRLKLFDFRSAISRSHPDFRNDVIRDHFDLSTCLHFLLSGVDPFANVRSRQEADKVRGMMESGRWTIGEGAKSLADIIQDGWAGRTSHRTFHDVLQQAVRILGAPIRTPPPSPEEHYGRLESRCQDWFCLAQRHPSWKPVHEYVAACRMAGHEGDLDVWR